MDYIEILQYHKLKVTPQRIEIVKILYKEGHISINNLYKLLQKKFPSLSLATIYKNINKMCEKLFLSEVKIPDKKNVYELRKKEHSHVICSKCNYIMDLNLNISSIIEEAQSISKYNLSESSIILKGICHKCLDKEAM